MRSNIGFLLSSAATAGLSLNGAAIVLLSSTNTLRRLGWFSQTEPTGATCVTPARGGRPPAVPAAHISGLRENEHAIRTRRLGASCRGRMVAGLPRGLGLAHWGGGRAADERPDFLDDGAPVGGGGQFAEYREEAEVDALEDHVRPRDADVLRDWAAQVEEAVRDGGGVVAGDGHWPWFADGFVEDGQVLDDLLGAERRARAQESGVLQAAAEGLGVVLDAYAAGHLDEWLQFGRAEMPDEPEVKEGDLAAAVEQVVARVRVAVEGAHVVQAAEDEAVDRLGGQVAFVLRPGGEFGEAGSAGWLPGHQPAGGQLADDPGDVNGGMAVVVRGQQALVGGLAPVVEFLADPFPHLAQQRVDVLGGRGDAEHPAQQRDVAQVGRDGLGDARVLDLDGDRAAVEGDRPVHLPDRGGRYRPRIPAGERPFRRRAEFFLHHRCGELRAHRRGAALAPGQGAADRGRQAAVDVAGHLADLHHDPLHRPQGLGDVLGGPQRQVLAQQLPPLARGREQPRRARRVAGPAPRGQPQRRPAAIKAQPPGPAAQQDQRRGARPRT